MLISFDPNAVTTKRIKVASVTTALGGSVQYVDETKDDAKLIKQQISVGVARRCVKDHGTRHVIPRESCMLSYEGRAIALEITDTSERYVESIVGEPRLWTSELETAWNNVKQDILASGYEWFFDGRYVYTFGEKRAKQSVIEGGYVDVNGSFRAVDVRCYDLTTPKAGIVTRSCMAYYVHDDAWSISPPAWKSLTVNSDETIGSLYTGINDHRGVNLNFALYAASALSGVFNSEVIEPLGLPGLMIKRRTVNLCALDKSVKYMTQIDMHYTHALAWLIGLCRSATTLSQLIAIKSSIVYLTKTGFFDMQRTKLDSVMISIPKLVTLNTHAANDEGVADICAA